MSPQRLCRPLLGLGFILLLLALSSLPANAAGLLREPGRLQRAARHEAARAQSVSLLQTLWNFVADTVAPPPPPPPPDEGTTGSGSGDLGPTLDPNG
jgi:hypothetical protein